MLAARRPGGLMLSMRLISPKDQLNLFIFFKD